MDRLTKLLSFQVLNIILRAFLVCVKLIIHFGGWESILLGPFITSITAAMATLIMSPLGVTGVASERSRW